MRTILAFGGRMLASGVSSIIVIITSLVFALALTLSGSFAASVAGFLGSLGVNTAYGAVATQRDGLRRGLAGVQSENRRLKSQATKHRQLVQRVNNRVFARTLRSTARSVSAIGLEAMPVIGVAALIGTTAWEVHDGCANLSDLHELYEAFGVAPEYPDYQQSCIAYTAKVDALKGQADGVMDWLED